jgi:hypothetical protein
MEDITKLTGALEENDDTIDVLKAELNSLQVCSIPFEFFLWFY